MARVIQLKTAKEIEQVAKLKSGKDFVEPGLYLQVNGNAISWLHRYTFKGKSRWFRLGSYPELSLAGARAKLRDERAKIRAGIDRGCGARAGATREGGRAPEEEDIPRGRKGFHRQPREPVEPKHRDQWPSTLETYVYPFIGDMISISSSHGTQLVACGEVIGARRANVS